jgi:hypothetical protein
MNEQGSQKPIHTPLHEIEGTGQGRTRPDGPLSVHIKDPRKVIEGINAPDNLENNQSKGQPRPSIRKP